MIEVGAINGQEYLKKTVDQGVCVNRDSHEDINTARLSKAEATSTNAERSTKYTIPRYTGSHHLYKPMDEYHDRGTLMS